MFSFLTSFVSFTDQFIYALIVPGVIAGLALIAASLFLPSFAYKVPALLIGVITVLFFTYYSGKQTSDAKWKIKEAEHAMQVAVLEARASEITTETVVMYVDRVKVVEKIRTEFKTIYVDKFITPEIDAKFGDLPHSFRLLHDYAAQGILPPTTGSPNGTTGPASGIKLSGATKVIVDNYFICHRTGAQLLALQEWIRAQEKLYNQVKQP
jgi:hypothetical protein